MCVVHIKIPCLYKHNIAFICSAQTDAIFQCSPPMAWLSDSLASSKHDLAHAQWLASRLSQITTLPLPAAAAG